MDALPDLIRTVHVALLGGFICVTLLLMLVTVANRLRVRRVVLSWRTGRFGGMPLWPALFILLVGTLMVAARVMDHRLPTLIFVGYLLGGLCWLVSVLLSGSCLVTEYGLIRNVNRASQSVAWGQVVDYFEITRGRQHGYVFFYLDAACRRRRLEVLVPPAYRERFALIVQARLDARFEYAVQEALGNQPHRQ